MGGGSDAALLKGVYVQPLADEEVVPKNLGGVRRFRNRPNSSGEVGSVKDSGGGGEEIAEKFPATPIAAVGRWLEQDKAASGGLTRLEAVGPEGVAKAYTPTAAARWAASRATTAAGASASNL